MHILHNLTQDMRQTVPGFSPFVDKLTQVSRLIGKPQKLERLVSTCTEEVEHWPHRAALQSSSYLHAKIYDKRWGTLTAAMEMAGDIEGPLRAIWNLEKFLHGSGNPKNARELDVKLLDEAVQSELFWCYRVLTRLLYAKQNQSLNLLSKFASF